MSELMLNLIELIKQGTSIEEISIQMNLSYRQIYHLATMLKNKGFLINRKYYCNGDMLYLPNYTNEKKKQVDIYSFDTDKEFRALLISDLHLGSQYDNINYINMAFDYCKKNGINVIISGGDLIDGDFGQCKKKHDNIYDQIEYAISTYPHDKEILTFTVLGDHDETISRYGLDLSEVLNNRRHDVVPIGYEAGIINIKNDFIHVKHHSFGTEKYKTSHVNNRKELVALVLLGHSHCLKFRKNSNALVLSLPSLSDLQFNNFVPSFIDMTLTMERGYFEKGSFSVKGILNNNIINIVDNEFSLLRKGTSNKKSPIEEEKTKVRKKTQVEKFTEKWGEL